MAVSREKKTLVIFIGLLLFGALCILAYIVVGHNWNYTATELDDTFGDMEGYTVYLYEGTIVPEKTAKADGTAQPEKSEASSQAEKTDAANGAGQTESADARSLFEKVNNRLSLWFNLDTDSEATQQDVDAVSDDEGLAEDVSPDDLNGTRLDVQEVANAYREKKATVFVIDTTDFGRYAQGDIVEHGNVRMGCLSVSSMESVASLQEKIDGIRAKNVDKVVLLTTDASYCAGILGIDIVIQAGDTLPHSWDFTPQGRYVTLAPERGSVAATLITGSIAKTKIITL